MRSLIRNLQGWRSSFEALDVGEVLVDPIGREWVLWDVERFYDYRSELPGRQRAAIELMLYHNYFERDVARMMGISESNPVGVYVTVGLSRLLRLARSGELAGCQFEFEVDLIPVRQGRAGHPRCAGCSHSASLHGRSLGACRATGCRCEAWEDDYQHYRRAA